MTEEESDRSKNDFPIENISAKVLKQLLPFQLTYVHQVVEGALKSYILNLKVQVHHYLKAAVEPWNLI